MRTLPDSPSLDHLRRQAKDHLAVLRARQPQATLHDAQASVAEQYGFDSWSDLKHEVARREAAPPRTAAPGLAATLATAFALGSVEGPMTHVERQWGGEVWDLCTDRGRWIATELQPAVSPAGVDLEAAFVGKAMAGGVLALEPMPASDGSFVAAIEGANWRVHRWERLGPPLPQPPSPEVAAEGGRILARIHNLELPATGPVVPWLTRRAGESSWAAIVDAAHASSRDWADDLAVAVPGFLALDAIVDTQDPNPRAILSKAFHAPVACRPVGDTGLVCTGWEHAGSTPKDWDLAYSVMAWSETVENDYDLTAARAFLEGYAELAGPVLLTPPMFTSGVTAALNWTISRANIALHADDPVDRAEAERAIRVLARNPITPASVENLVNALT